MAEMYQSSADRTLERSELKFRDDPGAEMELVRVYPDITKQTILGFGGAVTESSAWLYSQMDQSQREQFISAYYGSEGAGYTLARTHFQSCDFSLGSYSGFKHPWHRSPERLTLERDQRWVIPMLHDAAAAASGLEVMGSPWSPPAFMKTNHIMLAGGHLKPKYRDRWAQMLAGYVRGYRELGVNVTRMTVQNEPNARQTWESCLMDAEEEATFAADSLAPALSAAGVGDCKILVWDHNKERLLERASAALDDPARSKVVAGAAFHWYTGDHFETVAEARLRWPAAELVASEACVEYSLDSSSELAQAQHYAHDVIGDLAAGANAWIDWNILLDEKGGPNHVGNYCAAPARYDTKTGKLTFARSHAYLSQVTRFVRPGAVRLLTSRWSDAVECVAFANPDGSHVCVVLNRRDEQVSFRLFVEGRLADVSCDPLGILTIRW